jgi:NADPH-dependent ferric siderophore reductase
MSDGASNLAISESRPDPRMPQRVRHPSARRRTLTVQRVESIAPQMKRITFGGDLHDFVSLGFDDHIKMFFPDGTSSADGGPNTVGRDFTPRRYDASAQTLQIDFAVHEAGPATQWAVSQAKPGESLTIGGPRGSFVIPLSFDWHLFVGDETAIPAIGRRLEELPAGTRAVVVAEVDSKGDEIAFTTKADVAVAWTHRNGAPAGTVDGLAKALAAQKLPSGDYYAWVACESLVAKTLRGQLLADCGANPKWTRAAGYWCRGAAAVHEMHEG